MKKKNRLYILTLAILILLSSCFPRRISYLENRREEILSQEKKEKIVKPIEFNPDDIDKFKSMDDYLTWYSSLKLPAKLKFDDKKEKQALTNEQMIEDFDYFFKQIKDNYPFFGVLKRKYGIDFLANYNNYLNEVKFCKNDQEFIKTMQKIAADLNNDHANIADKDYVEESLDYYSKFFNDPSMYYEFLSMNKETVRDRYEINGVQTDSDKFNKRQKHKKEDEKEKSEESEQEENISFEKLENGIGLIKIREMLAEYELDEDMNRLDDFLKENKDLKTIVIDIRDNTGGNTEYWQSYLMPRLINKKASLQNHMFFKNGMRSKLLLESEDINYEEIENVNISKMELKHSEDLKNFSYYCKEKIEIEPLDDNSFDGELYLLVNEGVYSAAEGLASFCKNTKIATLVGNKTGGDGITLGIINDVMPNSGLVFTYTNTLGYAPDKTINEEEKTEADIYAESLNESLAIIKEIEK